MIRNLISNNIERYFKKIILSLSFLLYLPRFTDPDLWWHLRLGRELLQGNSINNLTFTCTNYIWVNYSWLTDVAMYLTFHNWGYLGLALLTSLIFIIGNYVNFLTLKHLVKQELNINLNGFITLTFFLVFNFFFLFFFIYARPQIFAFLFFSLLFNRLIKGYLESFSFRDYLMIGLIIISLVNVHGSFIIGLALTGLFLIVYLIKLAIEIITMSNIELVRKDLSKFYKFSIIILLFLVLSLFNPFGTNIWKEVFSQIFSNLNSLYVTEWAPINFHTAQGLLYLAIVILCLIFILLNKKIDILRHLLFLCFVFIAFYSIRYQIVSNIIITIILFFEIFSFVSKFKFSFHKDYEQLVKGLNILITIIFFTIIISIPFNLSNLKSMIDNPIKNSVSIKLPYQAVNYIKYKPNLLNLNYFNEYTWGGYLDFIISEKKWFIDGRMSNWICSNNPNGSILTDYISISRIEPNWLDLLNEYTINGLIISKDSPLSNVIKYLPNWELEYTDDIAVIYRNKSK